MKCPLCGYKTKIVKKVTNEYQEEIYRSRACPHCEHTFYTVEYEVEETKQFKRDFNQALHDRFKEYERRNREFEAGKGGEDS